MTSIGGFIDGILDGTIPSDKQDYYLGIGSQLETNPFKINYSLDDFYFEKESSELFKNYRNTLLNLIYE